LGAVERARQVDLTGGYYDGGDNVKFGFPMAFTATMLSWSIIEYGGRMEGRVHDARAAVRWATDYLLKAATATPGVLYVGVGDADADHHCWERPEDMDTPRTVYSVSASAPGSDVAGETAAALAAASVVFKAADPAYSRRLVTAAKDVMAFAWQHQGKYSDHVGGGVSNYYPSYSGYTVSNQILQTVHHYHAAYFFSRFSVHVWYVVPTVQDELLWGSAWLLWATKNTSYLADALSLGANDGVDMFSWDNKLAGARILLSRVTNTHRATFPPPAP
jgi:endoglucanase